MNKETEFLIKFHLKKLYGIHPMSPDLPNVGDVPPVVPEMIKILHPKSENFGPEFSDHRSVTRGWIAKETGIDPKAVSLSPMDMFDCMMDVALGIVATDIYFKEKGIQSHVNLLEKFFVAPYLGLGKDKLGRERLFSDYLGALRPDENLIIIHPRLVLMHQGKDLNLPKRIYEEAGVDALFDAREMAVRTGMEEAVHMHQWGRDGYLAEGYDLTKFSSKQYAEDKHEKEALEIQKEITDMMGLGSKNAGTRTL